MRLSRFVPGRHAHFTGFARNSRESGIPSFAFVSKLPKFSELAEFTQLARFSGNLADRPGHFELGGQRSLNL